MKLAESGESGVAGITDGWGNTDCGDSGIQMWLGGRRQDYSEAESEG